MAGYWSKNEKKTEKALPIRDSFYMATGLIFFLWEKSGHPSSGLNRPILYIFAGVPNKKIAFALICYLIPTRSQSCNKYTYH